MLSSTARDRMSRWLAAVRRDDGMALATVMAISAVLFLLATTLVMLSTQQTLSAAAKTLPTVTGKTADASWTVTAVPPGAGSAVTQLTSTGRIAADDGGPAVTRIIKATVNPGSFADYMFLYNTDLTLAADGLIRGRVWCNGSITNNGEITDYAYASGSVGGSGIYDKTPTPNAGTKVFSTVDFATLKSIATTDGTYYSMGSAYQFATQGAVGANSNRYTHAYLGYNVVLSGNGGTITKITSISTTSGAMGLDASTATNFTTPPNGVLYFDDPIWVGGTYSAKLTIVEGDDIEDGTNNDPGMSGMNPTSTASPEPNNVNSSVFIWKNLVSSDPSNADQVCGIVTKGDISLTSEYPTTVTPDRMTVQAAMLSTVGSIHADLKSGVTKAYLKILGARAQWETGGVQSGSPVSSGYIDRDYWYDTNLDITTPPNFPPLGDGTLKVQQWVEN